MIDGSINGLVIRDEGNDFQRPSTVGSKHGIHFIDLVDHLRQLFKRIGRREGWSFAIVDKMQWVDQLTGAGRSVRKVADILGIDQATLWRRRKKYGV